MKRNCVAMFLVVVFFAFFSTFALATSTEGVVVKRGDTMWDISLQHGVSFGEVIKLNHKRFKNVNLIHEGDVVLIPKVVGALSREKTNVLAQNFNNNVAKEIPTKRISAKTNHIVKESHFSALEIKILKFLGFVALVLATFFFVRRILPYFCRENWESSYDCDRKQKANPEEIFTIAQRFGENEKQSSVVECEGRIFNGISPLGESSTEKDFVADNIPRQVKKDIPGAVVSLGSKIKDRIRKREKTSGFIAVSKETKKFTFVGLNVYNDRNVSGWCACNDLVGLAKYMVFARGNVIIDQKIFEIPEYLQDEFCSLDDSHQKELEKLTAELSLKNVGGPLSVVWKNISNE